MAEKDMIALNFYDEEDKQGIDKLNTKIGELVKIDEEINEDDIAIEIIGGNRHSHEA